MATDSRKLTIVIRLTVAQLKEMFGDELKKWTSGAKLKVVGPHRYVGIQSPMFTSLGKTGMWELAATLKLPVVSISEEDAWQ